MRSTAAPYTESRLTRSVANERVGFPVVEQLDTIKIFYYMFGSFLLPVKKNLEKELFLLFGTDPERNRALEETPRI